MPACKACGAWFVKVKPHEELCDKCECALGRLSSYFARVTRCKDCKHYDLGVCLKIYSDGNAHPEAWQSRRPEDFCSYGERKEGADKESVSISKWQMESEDKLEAKHEL